MKFEIGKEYVLDCYFSETRRVCNGDEDQWETARGKGGTVVIPLTEYGVYLLEQYEMNDVEIDLETDDFEYDGLEHGGANIEEEPEYFENALIVSIRGNTELFEGF
jgi:hypothetical protein